MAHMQPETPVTARDRRTVALADFKRSAILEAARQVLERDGADGLTMRAVASAAGYAPAAVYLYFDSKAALLAALATQDLARLARDLRTGPARGAAERASAASHAFAGAFALLANEEGALAPEAERALTGRLIALLQTVSEPLALQALEPRDAQARALAFAAAAAGLGLLARSGRLAKLGIDAEETLDALARRLQA